MRAGFRTSQHKLKKLKGTEMIEFKNVSFAYDKNRPVLKNISFRIEAGESVGLIGANGAGKSTIMKILPGLLPCEGEVYVDGLRVEKNNLSEIRRKLGFVLQNSDDQMFMPTVFDDMMFAPRNYGMTAEEAERKVDEVLAELELTELKHRYNHKISGGEKRMAAIATILAMEPKAILMDEPSTALDPVNRRKVINTVRQLKMTRLIASHDLDMILDTCERVLLIYEGELVADGPAEAILSSRELLENNHMELPLCMQNRQNNK